MSMMSSLLTLLASPLLLQVQAGASCDHRDHFQTKIVVQVDKKPINYIRNVTVKQLQSRLGKTLYKRQKEIGENFFLEDKKDEHVDLSISGTTSADTSINTDINFLSLPQNAEQTRLCLIFKSVGVRVTYQTNMTIAQDFEEGSCVYNAVLKHQMKHHEANEKIVDTVVKKLEADLPAILSGLEHNYVSYKYTKGTYAKMKTGLMEELERYQNDIDGLIKEYGAFIDTPEALKELAESCPE